MDLTEDEIFILDQVKKANGNWLSSYDTLVNLWREEVDNLIHRGLLIEERGCVFFVKEAPREI